MPKPSDLVKARWVAGFTAEVEGVGLVHFGDIVEVPRANLDSDHWEAVGGAAKAAERGDS